MARDVDDDADSSSSSSSSGSEDEGAAKVAKCIQRVANMSAVKPTMLLDTKVFNADLFRATVPKAAPKLMKLLEKIRELDALDTKRDGHAYKHMIFTDIDSSGYGAKLIASAFVAFGFEPAFARGSLALRREEQLLETKGRNFGLLLSKAYGKKTMSTRCKKEQLARFNRRPDNVHGDLVRFMILDQGFKEGIDLFDVKYVHLFEPMVSRADEKQAIGRSTRFCGQKGLQFHPRFGWPLYVFRYDVAMAMERTKRKEIDGAKTLFELYLKYSDIDMRRVVFAAELDKAVVGAAVDTQLTEEIHSFKIEDPPPVLGAGGAVVTRSSARSGRAPPAKVMGLEGMRDYVKRNFGAFKYPRVKMENMCLDKEAEAEGAGARRAPAVFTPTQDFVRHFFQPASAYKGILFFHSVGTGKTCSAIATATTSFEKAGYSILWVTRHTLKSDIWKNMFETICSIDVQERMAAVAAAAAADGGKKRKGAGALPRKIGAPMRFVSKRWIEPVSYKQFSNMLLKKNKYYDEIVERNGKSDPLRKTLIIIDEAHKLYAPGVAKSEKPQVDILERMIQNSYRRSGKDSVRVVLMTATPYTEDGTEMLRLLNLLRPAGEALPVDFDAFAARYLDAQGYFTKRGLARFQDGISGYVSYINRSQDARNFAHPVVENVHVEMTVPEEEVPPKHHDLEVKERVATIKELRGKAREEAAAVKEFKRACKAQARELLAQCKEEAAAAYAEGASAARAEKAEAVARCAGLVVKERKPCKERAAGNYRSEMEDLRQRKADALGNCKVACVADNGKRIADSERELEGLRAAIAAEQQKRDETKGLLKEYNAGNKVANAALKGLREEMRELRVARRELAAKIKALRAELKAAKANGDAKKVGAVGEKLKPLVAKKKELDMELLDVRSRATNLVSNKKLARMGIGRAVIGDVSQETALYRRCLSKV